MVDEDRLNELIEVFIKEANDPVLEAAHYGSADALDVVWQRLHSVLE